MLAIQTLKNLESPPLIVNSEYQESTTGRKEKRHWQGSPRMAFRNIARGPVGGTQVSRLSKGSAAGPASITGRTLPWSWTFNGILSKAKPEISNRLLNNSATLEVLNGSQRKRSSNFCKQSSVRTYQFIMGIFVVKSMLQPTPPLFSSPNMHWRNHLPEPCRPTPS